MDAKERKRTYGVTMAPIPCTEAWRRRMAFDHNKRGMTTWSYILVNRYTGKRIHVNTYDGKTGEGHNTDKCTYAIKKFGTEEGEKELRKSLNIDKPNAYYRCLISDCPVAEPASPPEGWSGPVIVEPSVTDPPPGTPQSAS